MGWWNLDSDCELKDEDREHIARLIKEGYMNGKVCQEDEYDYGDDEENDGEDAEPDFDDRGWTD